jgi:PAS domain S-box-containing protein
LDLLPQPVLVMRGDRILYANPVLLRATGFALHELTSTPSTQFIAPIDSERAAVRLARIARGENVGPIILAAFAKNGARIMVEVDNRGELLFDSAPARLVVLTFLETNPEPTPEALFTSSKRLELVERVTNAAVYDLNLVTGRLEWNDNLRAVFGYTPNTVGHSLRDWSERVHPHDREHVLESLESAQRNADDPWTDEYRFRHASGNYVHVLARTLVVRDDFRRPIRIISALLDINERKQMQARLQLADRMASVGTLAAGVAHEINNPLTYVIANISFAASQLQRSIGIAHGIQFDDETAGPTVDLPQGANDIVQALAEAQEGAERVRLIVRDLKLFSRPSDDVKGPVNLRRIIDSSISMAQNEIKHRAQLIRDLGDVPPVSANEARLGQVLLNLLVNAAQAIPEGAVDRNKITVTTRVDTSGRVIIEVRDTGCGIPNEMLGRIFDPFFTTKPAGIGTGLGLPICHGIITSIGGTIEVDSAVGRGSTFRVVLPPESTAQTAVPAVVQTVQTPDRGNVLVVDDEPLVAKSVQRILATEQNVSVSSSAEHALDRLRSGERFDVIFCDMMMPKMTGMDFYEELQNVSPDQRRRVVFISGGALTSRMREFLQKVPNRKLEKPFDAQPLRSLVHEMRAI